MRRLHALEFSSSKVIRSVHTGGVSCLDLDAVEQRYLLAGAGDASIAVYDTQQPSSAAVQEDQEAAREAAAGAAAVASNARFLRASGQAGVARARADHTEHAALFSITKQAPQAHRFSVSAVAWYPVDSGLFVSGRFGVESVFVGSIWWGSAGRSVVWSAALWDVPQHVCPQAGRLKVPHFPPFLACCRHPTGGFDNQVKAWDANTLQVGKGCTSRVSQAGVHLFKRWGDTAAAQH